MKEREARQESADVLSGLCEVGKDEFRNLHHTVANGVGQLVWKGWTGGLETRGLATGGP